MIPLFLNPDGNFPNHHPSPIEAKNREHARNTLLLEQADVAFLFDGDADRVILLDEAGNMVNSAVISAAIAEKLISQGEEIKFIGNTVTSHNFRDFIEEN